MTFEVVGALYHLIELVALVNELLAVEVIVAAVVVLGLKRGTVRTFFSYL